MNRRVLFGAAIAVSLGIPTPVAGQAAPGPSASPSVESVVGQVLDASLAGLTTPDAISERGREVVALDRDRLAAIDPGLPDALDELEARSEEELATWLETVLPSPEGSPEPSPAIVAVASPVPSAPSEGRTRRSFLAARGPDVPSSGRILDQGGSYLSAVGQVAGAVDDLVGAVRPDKGSSRDPAAPYVRGDTRFELRSARERDTVTIGISITETYSIPSRTPGQPPITVTDAGEAIVIVDVCPDEDGTVVATATTNATVDAAGNGLTYHVIADADDTAHVTVSDKAMVSSVAHTGSMSRHATGDRAVFSSGGEGSAESNLEGTASWTSDGSGSVSPMDVQVEVADGGNDADIRAWAITRGLAGSLTDAAIAAASRVWRDGRCLELKVDPPGKTVAPGSETEITVTIDHKAFDDEIERDVTATLDGTQEVAPLDPVRAPASFTYTATSEPEGEGTITFASTSNRGIAKERAETYRVEARYLLDTDQSVTYSQSGVTARGTVKGRGLQVTPIAGDPETGEAPGVTVEGDLDFKGRARSPGCTGTYHKAFAVDPATNASARIAGEGEDRRLVVTLRLADPSAQVTARVSCDGASVALPIPLGRMLPRIEVELPLAGGSLTRQGNESGARWKGTFTLRRDEG